LIIWCKSLMVKVKQVQMEHIKIFSLKII
jgi:hypothetical protein